ncbi:hypothetical protein Tco_1275432 [Tanacetum coccineum]
MKPLQPKMPWMGRSGQKGVAIKKSPISNVGSHVQFHSVETVNVIGGDVQNFTSNTSMVEGSDINNATTTSIVAESSSEMHVDDFSQWMMLEVLIAKRMLRLSVASCVQTLAGIVATDGNVTKDQPRSPMLGTPHKDGCIRNEGSKHLADNSKCKLRNDDYSGVDHLNQEGNQPVTYIFIIINKEIPKNIVYEDDKTSLKNVDLLDGGFDMSTGGACGFCGLDGMKT